jgi:hypothetical protein
MHVLFLLPFAIGYYFPLLPMMYLRPFSPLSSWDSVTCFPRLFRGSIVELFWGFGSFDVLGSTGVFPPRPDMYLWILHDHHSYYYH